MVFSVSPLPPAFIGWGAGFFWRSGTSLLHLLAVGRRSGTSVSFCGLEPAGAVTCWADALRLLRGTFRTSEDVFLHFLRPHPGPCSSSTADTSGARLHCDGPAQCPGTPGWSAVLFPWRVHAPSITEPALSLWGPLASLPAAGPPPSLVLRRAARGEACLSAPWPTCPRSSGSHALVTLKRPRLMPLGWKHCSAHAVVLREK